MSDFQNSDEDDEYNLTKFQREILFLQGEKLKADGRLDEALILYLKSLEKINNNQIFPGFPLCLKSLAIYFFAKEDYAKSLQFVKILVHYLKSALAESEVIYAKIAEISSNTISLSNENLTESTMSDFKHNNTDGSDLMISYDLGRMNSLFVDSWSTRELERRYKSVVPKDCINETESGALSKFSDPSDENAEIAFQKPNSVLESFSKEVKTTKNISITETIFDGTISKRNKSIDWDQIKTTEIFPNKHKIPTKQELDKNNKGDEPDALNLNDLNELPIYPAVKPKTKLNAPNFSYFYFGFCLLSFVTLLVYFNFIDLQHVFRISKM